MFGDFAYPLPTSVALEDGIVVFYDDHGMPVMYLAASAYAELGGDLEVLRRIDDDQRGNR